MQRTDVVHSAITINTTMDERALLRSAGFVHVTGLTPRFPGSPRPYDPIRPLRNSLGCYDSNNGVLVVVTGGGEVWIARPVGGDNLRVNIREVLRTLCPNGQGAYVPCSNGEDVHASDLLKRHMDPDWQPRT